MLVLLFTGCGGGSGSGLNPINANVAVDFAQALPATKSMTGFLHAMNGSTPVDDMITPLRPKLWRGDYDNSVTGPNLSARAISLGAQFAVVCSDSWGYGFNELPTHSMTVYKDAMAELATEFSGKPVVYDIWNEPDTSLYWPSDDTSFDETFKAAHDAIRGIQSNALIGGPSYSAYDHDRIQSFLNYCLANNVRLDVLSWHEFRSGGDIANIQHDLAEARADFVSNPKYAALGIKKIEINEAIYEPNQLEPASTLAVLDQLELGGADAAAHACWTDPTGYSNCSSNDLDGLLTPDTKVPRAVWWTYKAYSDGVASRVASSSNSSSVVSVASSAAEAVGSTTPQAQVLIGAYAIGRRSAQATLVFNHLSAVPGLSGATAVKISITAIADTEATPVPALPAPTIVTAPVAGDSAQATMPLASEAIYIVTLAPG